MMGQTTQGRPIRVLFLCTHNSARSQMAEGWLRARGGAAFEAHSAGTVATSVRPEAIAVMDEVGIDIRGQRSRRLHIYLNQPFDLVITVCDEANEVCPVFPHARERWHWSVDDPSRVEGPEEIRLEAFRRVRDELRRRIEAEVLPLAARRGSQAGGELSRIRTNLRGESAMARARAHVFISGRVQGVNFRWHTQRQAEREGVTGWVRNLPDGRVEAVFEGEEQAVRRLVAWCRQGPPAARVDDVEVHWEPPAGEFQDFSIRWWGGW